MAQPQGYANDSNIGLCKDPMPSLILLLSSASSSPSIIPTNPLFLTILLNHSTAH